jgi:hypothetical protein
MESIMLLKIFGMGWEKSWDVHYSCFFQKFSYLIKINLGILLKAKNKRNRG